MLETPPLPYPEGDDSRIRSSLYFTGEISLITLGNFLPASKKADVYRYLKPEYFFGKQDDVHVARVKSLMADTSMLNIPYDSKLVGMFALDARVDDTLSKKESEESAMFVEGVFKTLNYYFRLRGASGKVESFIAMPGQAVGAVVEANENERLSLAHLRAIISKWPQVAKVLAHLDKYYAEPFGLDPKNPDDYKTWVHKSPDELLKELDLRMDDESEQNAVKLLGKAWYELLGMTELRAFQQRDAITEKYFPKAPFAGGAIGSVGAKISGSGYVDKPAFIDRLEKGVGLERFGKYAGIKVGYNTVFYWAMDPLTLEEGILKMNRVACRLIRWSARHVDQSKYHNSFNLGWMPAGHLMLEQLAGRALSTQELSKFSLDTFDLSRLTDDDWSKLISNVDYQKIMITNLEKADKAKVAFIQLFSGDVKSIITIFDQVGSYLRTQAVDKDLNNPWTRTQIFPMIASAVIEILEEIKRSGMPLPTYKDMAQTISTLKMKFSPDTVFTKEQQDLLLKDLSTPEHAVAAAMMSK